MADYVMTDGAGTKVREDSTPAVYVDLHPYNLGDGSGVVGGDLIATQPGSSTPLKSTVNQVVAAGINSAGGLRWTLVGTAAYTATPASTSVITMSNTTGMAVGLPVKFTYNSNTYYAIITAVSSNASITIAGAALATGGGANDLAALYVGCAEMVVQMDFFVSSTWASTAQDLLLNNMKAYAKWRLGQAYLVAFSAVQKTADNTTNGKLNMKVGGSAVSTNDSNNGIQLSTAGTWVDNSAVAINTTNYSVSRGSALEVACTVVGGTKDGSDLTVSCVFVLA